LQLSTNEGGKFVAFKVIYNGDPDPAPLRQVYSHTLMELFKNNPNIVAGEADVGNGMWKPNYKLMKDTYGDRFFDVGIQEANLAGVAAGLSVTGKIPYIHTFAPFITRRTYDIAFVSCSYAKLNIRMIGSDPGITSTFNGGTHMTFEDIGIMRNIPEMTIIDISDGVMLKSVLYKTSELYGMFYIRFPRDWTPATIYSEESEFEFGKANVIREGSDITIIASGIMVDEAMKAADILKEKGVSARVVDMFTIKPIDKDCIIKCASETGAIVTAENHSVINGLGSAVADILIQNKPCPLRMVGVQDEFGEVGSLSYLKERFGLNAYNIADTALKTISIK
jgi:transketolase